MRPRVLIVSKAIAPPFRDGTKCFVRELVTHVTSVDTTIMSTGEVAATREQLAAAPGDLRVEAVYGRSDAYHSPLGENLRAMAFVATKRHIDLWHFAFAPNPKSSGAARALRRLRGLPVVQTVVSAPRSFDNIDALLFGDRVVCQSTWTRGRITAHATRELNLHVIVPPLPPLPPVSDARALEARSALDIDGAAPIVLYPGDLEVSRGAEFVRELVTPVCQRKPDAVFVFAYRQKTPRAEQVREQLEARLPASRVRFAKEFDDILALVRAASVVVFPVDDLWGKVDLPIVLLESMALRTPVVALGQGPLTDLDAACLIPSLATEEWTQAIVSIINDADRHTQLAGRAFETVQTRHSPQRFARAYEQLYQELLQ